MKLSDHFYYDPLSPTYLRWKIARGKRPINSTAGSLNVRNGKKDYIRVRYQGKQLAVARVIWELFFGTIPDNMVIDHLDGDKWNNSISNLEIKTQQQNMQNVDVRSDNKTGITGICVRQQRKGKYLYNYVFAYAGNGPARTKVFSIDKLGYDIALASAIQWRLERITVLNVEGHKYTSRHTKNCTDRKDTNDSNS